MVISASVTERGRQGQQQQQSGELQLALGTVAKMKSMRQWVRLSNDTSAAITVFPQSVADFFTGHDSNTVNGARL